MLVASRSHFETRFEPQADFVAANSACAPKLVLLVSHYPTRGGTFEPRLFFQEKASYQRGSYAPVRCKATIYRDTIYINEVGHPLPGALILLSRVGEIGMLAMRLVRLIEAHSETLSKGLTDLIRKSDRTSDFRRIPSEDLRLAATEVYRNLGEWLLQKTEHDISERFRTVAQRRASEGIRLHQFVWALMLSRDHLWRFLRHESFADNVVALYGEMELQVLLNQFFDRAIYHAITGYAEAAEAVAKDELKRARDLAISIGLMSAREKDPARIDTPIE